jgi:hypothetical protein
MNIIFPIGIYAEDKKDVKGCVSTWNFKVMFKFKLQDNQWEENYIPNWNFMLKTNFTRNTRQN